MSWSIKRNYSERDIQNLTIHVKGSDGEVVEVFKRAKQGLLVPRAYEAFSHPPVAVSLGGAMSDGALGDEISLRDEQVPAVQSVINALTHPGTGAILFAPCGKGKTVMGLEISRRMGRKTLVLVHKTFLVEQWVERAKAFLPNAKIGFWQRDELPKDDDDIVIGMVQSIVNPRKSYPQGVYEQFGMVLADETHRYAAPMWQEAISRFPSAYRVGLTATPERKDGLHEVFFLHIGPIVYEMEGHKRLPTIYKVCTDIMFEEDDYTMRNGRANTSKLVTMVSEVKRRTDKVCDFACRAARVGRKVLILSERVEHTKEMLALCKAALGEDYQVSLYIGASSKQQRIDAAEADIIIGSYAMAQEGLDIPALDTLILATPKTSVTQSVGRILRDAPDKKDPVVIDIVDDRMDILGAYWGARKRLYDKLGYHIRRT